MAKVKCFQCKISADRADMVYDKIPQSNGVKTRYLHEGCYARYIAEQQFKQSEDIGKDNCAKIIADIYGVEIQNLPRNIYSHLNMIRNGNELLTGMKYKDGATWDVIAEAYVLSMDAIRWATQYKVFESFMNEIRYGLAIVRSKLPDAARSLERKKLEAVKQEAAVKHHIENIEHFEREVEYRSTQPKRSNDISDLL